MSEVPYRTISFGEYSFYDTNITNIEFPSTVYIDGVEHLLRVDMSNNAFSNISTLSSVVLSEAVTQIIASVFANCTNLTTVSLSSQIIVDQDAFDLSYTEIVLTVTPTSTSTEIIANFIKDNQNIGTLIISDGITTIGSNAFYGSSITNVYFSGGISA